MSPLSVLARGYAIAEAESGIVGDVSKISVGDSIKLRFVDGSVSASVTEVTKRKDFQ